MLLVAISLSAWAVPIQPCGTLDHMTEFLSADSPPPVAPSTELIDHESHGSIPNTRYSEHFALKWGSDFDFSEEDAERLLNDFEFAHSVEVIDWEKANLFWSPFLEAFVDCCLTQCFYEEFCTST